jgi:helicase
MSLPKKLPDFAKTYLEKQNIESLRPSQTKAIAAGLFKGNSLLVCTPTASGKTLVGELALLKALHEHEHPITVYVVPLRALAAEKYSSFSKKFSNYRVTLTSGDMDSDDPYLADYSIIITTSEKLDSLLRHQAQWINRIRCVVVDEIHLLNDASRGPTLEVLLTMLRRVCSPLQLVGLSATIGNASELAAWLEAELVEDSWRPIPLKEGVYVEGDIYFNS